MDDDNCNLQLKPLYSHCVTKMKHRLILFPMKSLAALLLSMIMLFQGSASVWIAATFYANREYIAQNECENRFVAASSCLGQCVLMKKLQKEEDRKQDQAEKEIKGVQLFVSRHLDFDSGLQNYPLDNSLYIPYTQLNYSGNFSGSIFRPPIA